MEVHTTSRPRAASRPLDPAHWWGEGDYELRERAYAPIHRRLIDTVDPRAGERVLDVACGLGAVAAPSRSIGGSATASRCDGVDCGSGSRPLAGMRDRLDGLPGVVVGNRRGTPAAAVRSRERGGGVVAERTERRSDLVLDGPNVSARPRPPSAVVGIAGSRGSHGVDPSLRELSHQRHDSRSSDVPAQRRPQAALTESVERASSYGSGAPAVRASVRAR